MAAKIGLYGGSFDPIHIGHLVISRAIFEAMSLDRVIFLPSANPPHKGHDLLAAPHHRAEMVKLAIEGEDGFEFSDFDLRPGPTYTIDTVQHFHEVYGDADLHWIVGADSLAEITTWRRVGELVDTCRIMTAARPGWDAIDWREIESVLSAVQVDKLRQGVIETPRIDIAATDIRHRVSDHKSVRYLVPDAVLTYIQDQGLYQ